MTRLAMFTPTSYGDLRFEPTTAVIPIWPAEGTFSGAQVDWTDAQVIRGGIVRTNAHSQMLLIQPRTERGQLEFSAVQDGKLTVTNGFEWDLEQLIVRGEDQQYYGGGPIAAGGQATLAPLGEEELKAFVEELKRQKLTSPDLGLAPPNSSYSSYSPYGYSSQDMADPARVRAGQMERFLTRLYRLPEMVLLPARSYVALVSEAPSLDLGVQRVSIREQFHVLLGYY
jgi:hypothetical protein